MWRSILVTPALNRHMLQNATHSDAEMLLIDLEDSVLDKQKARARALALDFLEKEAGQHPFSLRINSITSEHGLLDLLALQERNVRLESLFIPNVESGRDVEIVDQLLSVQYPRLRYCAIIETPRGLANAVEIVKSAPKLWAIAFGAADFSDRLGLQMSWSSLLFARSQIVTAAAWTGALAFDSPCFQLHAPETLKQECEAAKDLGFYGKIAIHPEQLQTLNRIFRPDAELLAMAERILEASTQSEAGICVVDGMMIGPPMVKKARRLLRLSKKERET